MTIKSKKPKFTPMEIIGFARGWIADVMEWTAQETNESYYANKMLRAAIQRSFAAIGEAIKDIPAEILKLEPLGAWAPAMAFRNIVAHDYEEGLEHDVVWNTIRNDLPVLDAALARLEQRLKEQRP